MSESVEQLVRRLGVSAVNDPLLPVAAEKQSLQTALVRIQEARSRLEQADLRADAAQLSRWQTAIAEAQQQRDALLLAIGRHAYRARRGDSALLAEIDRRLATSGPRRDEPANHPSAPAPRRRRRRWPVVALLAMVAAGAAWFALPRVLENRELRYLPDAPLAIARVNVDALVRSSLYGTAVEQSDVARQGLRWLQDHLQIKPDEIAYLLVGVLDEADAGLLIVNLHTATDGAVLAERLKDDMPLHRVEFEGRQIYEGDPASLCVPEPSVILFGRRQTIEAVLKRNAPPELSASLRGAMDLRDGDAAVSAVIDVERALKRFSDQMPLLQLDFSQGPLAGLEAVCVEASASAGLDARAYAICKDQSSAVKLEQAAQAALSGLVKSGVSDLARLAGDARIELRGKVLHGRLALPDELALQAVRGQLGVDSSFGRRPPRSQRVQQNLPPTNSSRPAPDQPSMPAAPPKPASPPKRSIAEITQEKQRLLEAIEMGKRWQGVLRQGSLPVKVEIQFTGQAEQRTACISSSDDPWQRTLYRGAVQQQPAGFDSDSASPPAAWRLVLRADRSSFPLAKGWPEHIAFEAPPKNAQADRDLTRGNPPIDQRLLARVGAESIELSPPANAGGETQPAALLERLRQAVQPGVQWQGTGQAPDQASQEIKLTFCALRDEGGYARVVIEPADDPWSVRVFEGLVRLNATEAAAWPIQLAPDLRLSVQADGTLIGWQGRERLHLKTSQPTQNWQAPASLVRETVAPGRRYEGTVQSRGRAAEEIAVTFAERRGDGEYVRAIVEHKSDVLAAAVYEGAARFEESAVSGFSIVLTMKASGFGELPLFKAWADNLTLSFRPLPDGRSLYGYDSGGDRLKLSLAADAELPPLDTVSFSAMLREKCGPGKAWIGKLTNSQVNESADVHLTFGPQNADASSISAVVSVAKARGPKVNYEGVMHLDDARVNQFALELTKKTKGPVARSTVFNGWTDTKLLLRMSLDGSRLYGQAHHELLELRERNVHRVAPRRTMDEADSKQE